MATNAFGQVDATTRTPLLRAQTTRFSTVDVGHQTSADLNGILTANHLQASRALRFRHSYTLMRRRPLINDAFDQLI